MDVMKLLNNYPFTTLNDLDKFFFSCDTSNASDCFAYALKFLEKYPYVTMQDVEKDIIRGCTLSVIDTNIRTINSNREKEKLFGREHFEAGPLLHVHSVHVKPEDAIKDKPLSVYGTIRVKYEHIKSGKPMQLDVYNRSSDDADYISPRGGDLALGWPNTFPNCNDMWVGLQGTGIEVDLYLKIGDEGVPLVQGEILVGETTEGDFEEVISKEFHCEHCSATLIYIAMPFAVLCSVKVSFTSEDKGRDVNVAGKISARYKSTYGNYDSQECVLFEKQNCFEPVKMENNMRMSRTILGLPAYSSLELDLDLRDFNTNKELIKKKVALCDWNCPFAPWNAVVEDDLALIVKAGLIPYQPDGRYVWSDSDEDESCNESSSSPSSSSRDNDNTWCHLHGEKSIPEPSELMEFYSIFIGRKKLAPLKIFGTVELLSNYNTRYLFKRTREEAIEVEYSQKVLPFLDVCKSFSKFDLVELKVDLKDVGGKYQNKGFATYDFGFLYPGSSYNTQICSVLPGKDGFCALHYSMFTRACQANIEIFFKIKSDQLAAGKIYGSAIARYSNFDYSTKLKKDYFRSVLFKRTDKDPVHLKNDEEELVSQSVVVVPMDASLIIDVNFFCMSPKDRLFRKEKFKIGDCCSKADTKEKKYEFRIRLTWTDGLHDGRSEFHKHKATNDMAKVEMEAAELESDSLAKELESPVTTKEQPKAKLPNADRKMNGVI